MTSPPTEPRVSVKPVAGPTFRAVCRIRAGGSKRQKLLALLAGYADAGDNSPPSRELRRRLGLGNSNAAARKLDILIERLARDKLLKVRWAKRHAQPGQRGAPGVRNSYRVLLPAETEEP